ncbi:MAG: hypothetical protein HQL50_09405, partial [Magnetococcales bacterium]|nr:hypothetical protein [Magnetococcales bacterium]
MERLSVISSSLFSLAWLALLLGVSVMAGFTVAEQAPDLLSTLPLPLFLSQPLTHQADVPIITTLFGILAGFLVFFSLGYIWQGFLDTLRIIFIGRSLRAAVRSRLFENANRRLDRMSWFYYPLFTRQWRDFVHTLHRQRHPDSISSEGRVLYRATFPAEVHFNTANLVDTPMRVEFFRHLPGMLTGAGIVSTFAGILLGLTEFNPTVAPDQVTLQLKNLFTGVSTAFVASFFAISTAIVVTVIEKLILHWRYAQIGRLQTLIDSLFEAGAESDYLSRLVHGIGQGGGTAAVGAGGETASADPALTEALKRLNTSMDTQGHSFMEMRDALQSGVRSLGKILSAERAALPSALGSAVREGVADSMQKPLADLEAERSTLTQEAGRQESWMTGAAEMADVLDSLGSEMAELRRESMQERAQLFNLMEKIAAGLETGHALSTTPADPLSGASPTTTPHQHAEPAGLSTLEERINQLQERLAPLDTLTQLPDAFGNIAERLSSVQESLSGKETIKRLTVAVEALREPLASLEQRFNTLSSLDERVEGATSQLTEPMSSLADRLSGLTNRLETLEQLQERRIQQEESAEEKRAATSAEEPSTPDTETLLQANRKNQQAMVQEMDSVILRLGDRL